MARIILIICLLAPPLLSASQDRLLNQPLQVQSCKLTVSANSFYAASVIELTVFNPNNVEIESQHQFRLEKGQVITGLDLDLNGRFREGSIEEKWKANSTYNSIVGKRVDPAIVQMMSQDYYRLNIYPVPPKGTRRLRLHITQLLEYRAGKLWYTMRLPFDSTPDSLQVVAAFRRTDLPVSMEDGLFSHEKFYPANDLQRMTASGQNVKTDKLFQFSIDPGITASVVCPGRTASQSSYFLRFYNDQPTEGNISLKKLSVFWDVSYSMRNRNLSLELLFLENLVKKYQPEEIMFTLFSNRPLLSIPYRRGKDDMESIIEYLRAYKPGGATQYGNLNLSMPDGSTVLLFTDGVNSFGSKLPQTGNSVVHGIRTTPVLYDDNLRSVCNRTGGSLIDLDKNNLKDALEKISLANIMLLPSSNGHDGLRFISQHMKSTVAGTVIKAEGKWTGSGKLELGFAGHRRTQDIQTYFVSEICDSTDWQRINMLFRYDSVNRLAHWSDVLEFGIVERVVTRNTSFLVLERVEDYIRYNINPPKDLEDECQRLNYVYRPDYKWRMIRRLSGEEKVNQLVAFHKPYAEWWAKNAGVYGKREIGKAIVVSQFGHSSENTASAGKSGNEARLNPLSVSQPLAGQTQELASVVVTAMGVQRSRREFGYSTTRVTANELTAANPVYLANGLTGKVSGLQVQTINNGVFADTRIMLRGIRSLTGNNQPLLVLDNMPVDLRFLSAINPNDISNVTILKSPASTAIYGADGVNGAILVQTKKGSLHSFYRPQNYRLTDRSDVDYVEEVKDLGGDQMLATFRELEHDYADQPIFYFDIAELFYKKGMTKQAMECLQQASELAPGVQGQLAVAYILEGWKQFDMAIQVYRNILETDGGQISVKRDLALAFFQQGSLQEAAETYVSIIMAEDEYNNYLRVKQMSLQELNAVLVIRPGLADSLNIDPRLISTEPVDLKIDMASGRFGGYLEVSGPAISSNYLDSMQLIAIDRVRGYDAEQFSVYKAQNGDYRIKVNNYYYYGQARNLIPEIRRLVIFRKFQQPDQEIEIRNYNLTYQSGKIELDAIRWSCQ